MVPNACRTRAFFCSSWRHRSAAAARLRPCASSCGTRVAATALDSSLTSFGSIAVFRRDNTRRSTSIILLSTPRLGMGPSSSPPSAPAPAPPPTQYAAMAAKTSDGGSLFTSRALGGSCRWRHLAPMTLPASAAASSPVAACMHIVPVVQWECCEEAANLSAVFCTNLYSDQLTHPWANAASRHYRGACRS